MAPFTRLSPRLFGKLVTILRHEGAAARKGRPWSLPLEDRVLLVTAYWRTNLTLRQLAPLFGVSKSAADRIISHLGPLLALKPRRRFRNGTVLIVDGTLAPTRDHSVAERQLSRLGLGISRQHGQRLKQQAPTERRIRALHTTIVALDRPSRAFRRGHRWLSAYRSPRRKERAAAITSLKRSSAMASMGESSSS
ncbi:hypothetical protein QFZ22_000285 [Streptomyces canus]|uniref:Transposase Helix-turn-helix domain-containing protein n=1 Tax=Streptomyces canus TaxID=58343 RepID=A0AAW8F4Y5_9ACTN|nr:hypothetical protein [Streptomyces canus]